MCFVAVERLVDGSEFVQAHAFGIEGEAVTAIVSLY